MDKKIEVIKVMTKPLSMEEEFEIETEIRRILNLEDINELKILSALLMKQNACQAHVILQSIKKVNQLENTIKTLQKRVARLLRIKFRFLQPLKSILARNP